MTNLGITHPLIVEVRQADQCRATNATNHHDLRDLANDVMAFNCCQLAACCLTEGVGCELEQFDKRIRTACTATKCLESCTLGTNLGDIPLGKLSYNQQADEFLECLCPSDLGILNHDHGVAWEEFLGNGRQLVDEAILHAEAHSRATHQHIEYFIESTDTVDCNEGTVVASDIATLKCRTGGHQCPHGRHHLKVENRSLKFLAMLLCDLAAKMLVKEVEVTSNRFFPCLSSVFCLKPS